MSVIDVTKPAGKVFETAMLDAERAIAGTMSSGIKIAVRIAKLLKDRHTGDEEADYLKFEAKQYLKLGQDENSVRIAFGMIKSDLSICPKRIREAPHAYLCWLLKKAPTEITKKCKEIEHQINVAERRQVEPVFNSELLTVDVLTYEMIEMISAASKENKISIEVAATDKKRKLSGERVKMSKNPPCANCGSAEHGWADCKATTICGLKFCQCARNMACWVEADTMPTKDELKTAQGRNLPDSLINKLKETRKGKNKQVSAVEILDGLGVTLALEDSAVEVLGLHVALGSHKKDGRPGHDEEGSDTFRYANGDFYVGEWYAGKREGHGTYQDSDGNVYEGEWKADEMWKGAAPSGPGLSSTKANGKLGNLVGC